MEHNFTITSLDEFAKNKNIPLHATIELLTRCNCRCIHCYIPEHNDDGLHINQIKSILNDLRKLGTIDVTFTGGEIFLRKDIYEIIEHARTLNFRVYLLSNASVLNESIIKTLSKLYIAEFSTSIFSLKASIHDHITRVHGSLKKTVDNIFLMKKYNISIEIKTPILKENISEYKELIEFCKENNFKSQLTTAISSKNNGDISPTLLRVDSEIYPQIIKDIDLMVNAYVHKNTKVHFNPNDYLCKAIVNSIYIDCKGNVFPCNSFLYNIGSINENSIGDIWHYSIKLKKIRDIKKRDLKECSNCYLREYCNRCPGLALSEDKTIYGCSFVDRRMATVRKRIIDSKL